MFLETFECSLKNSIGFNWTTKNANKINFPETKFKLGVNWNQTVTEARKASQKKIHFEFKLNRPSDYANLKPSLITLFAFRRASTKPLNLSKKFVSRHKWYQNNQKCGEQKAYRRIKQTKLLPFRTIDFITHHKLHWWETINWYQTLNSVQIWTCQNTLIK